MTFSSHLHMVSPNVVPILHVLGVFFAFLQLFPQIASLLHFFAHFCHEHLASDNNQGKRSVFKLGQTEEQHCCHTKHYQSTANWNRTWHTSSSSSLDSLPKTSGKSACFQISGTMIVVWICNGKRSSNTMVPQIGLSWGGGDATLTLEKRDTRGLLKRMRGVTFHWARRGVRIPPEGGGGAPPTHSRNTLLLSNPGGRRHSHPKLGHPPNSCQSLSVTLTFFLRKAHLGPLLCGVLEIQEAVDGALADVRTELLPHHPHRGVLRSQGHLKHPMTLPLGRGSWKRGLHNARAQRQPALAKALPSTFLLHKPSEGGRQGPG